MDMRQIKFRAWSMLDKAYIDLWDIPYNEIFCKTPDTRPLIIEQYTGREDESGKDIYEGDIINAAWETINEPNTPDYNMNGIWEGVVEYQGCGYVIKQFNENYHPSLTNDCIKSIQIIGNINENQELIKRYLKNG